MQRQLVPNTVHVMVIDPSKMFYEGLCDFLRQGRYVVLGQYPNLTEALEQLDALNPDLAIVGPSLAEHESLVICQRLRSRQPDIKLIVLATHANDPLFQADAAYVGAAACLAPTASVEDCLKTIDWVMAGRQLFAREILAQAFQPLELTMREIGVLKQMAEGKTNAAIADALVILLSTVRSHRQHILEKLAAHNLQDAISRARRRGLV